MIFWYLFAASFGMFWFGWTWGYNRKAKELKRAKVVLQKHHDWHLTSGEVGLPDGDGGYIPINNADEYSEGSLCEETLKVLYGREG